MSLAKKIERFNQKPCPVYLEVILEDFLHNGQVQIICGTGFQKQVFQGMLSKTTCGDEQSLKLLFAWTKNKLLTTWSEKTPPLLWEIKAINLLHCQIDSNNFYRLILIQKRRVISRRYQKIIILKTGDPLIL
ncbi:MAG: hypothetical protein COX77_01265 [Candidatus Komeilibacteria bacterium CG_4_10_14_0_2_um_filter_37_10]|uniref:Uncharacterized protein n=1 Tax=Candidatus Komeilibacteria bacterium CG_4_10_14_0_2_um_filter_37_10 TaxID=1974470 RepID=A0A2M7VFX1_9BACT|nr:MAG: hypothetical protein COX77_01265 [Candidatus Komeilibacteria bacterium CG_4_10_14_0_2_um_filter_37_10]PJA94179.1 MAG: hypothetical protein CO133_00375 [Candidatus Komeilibacteria bacterium CG_4_9_14_3_um_filter_37_5]